MDAIKGNLLDMGWDIMEAGIDKGSLSIDGRRSHVCCQLEVLQLHRQGWRSQKQKSYQDKESGSQNKGVLGVYLTRHHGVRLSQPCPSSAGLFLGGVKGYLRDPEADLKLTVFSSCLGITVLGYPPLLEETPGFVAIVGIRVVQR